MEAPSLGREQWLPLEYEIISAAQLSRLRNKSWASELLLLGVSCDPTSAGIPQCEPITQESGYFQNVLCGSEPFFFWRPGRNGSQWLECLESHRPDCKKAPGGHVGTKHTEPHAHSHQRQSLLQSTWLNPAIIGNAWGFCSPILSALAKHLHNTGKGKATRLLLRLASHGSQSSTEAISLRG